MTIPRDYPPEAAVTLPRDYPSPARSNCHDRGANAIHSSLCQA